MNIGKPVGIVIPDEQINIPGSNLFKSDGFLTN